MRPWGSLKDNEWMLNELLDEKINTFHCEGHTHMSPILGLTKFPCVEFSVYLMGQDMG